MLIHSTDIRSAYKIIVRYVDKRFVEFTQEQQEAANELKRRIKRLENEYNRLIQLNNLLCSDLLPKTHFDESTGIMSTTFNGLTQSFKLNRADPNKPVKLLSSSTIGAYSADDSDRVKEPENITENKMDMEQLLEGYYNNAFRITKLAQTVTGKNKFHCKEITMVRNNLIVHPEAVSIYSFGYGSNGPIVKPIHRGQSTWVDNGLTPNTTALVKSLIELFY